MLEVIHSCWQALTPWLEGGIGEGAVRGTAAIGGGAIKGAGCIVTFGAIC